MKRKGNTKNQPVAAKPSDKEEEELDYFSEEEDLELPSSIDGDDEEGPSGSVSIGASEYDTFQQSYRHLFAAQKPL